MFCDPMFYHFFITRHLFLTKEKRKFVCTIEKGVTERAKDLIAGAVKQGNGRRMADSGRRTANGGWRRIINK